MAETLKLVDRQELIQKIGEIIRASEKDPADEMIQTGRVLMDIGEALKPLERDEAVRVLRAVAMLHGVEL